MPSLCILIRVENSYKILSIIIYIKTFWIVCQKVIIFIYTVRTQSNIIVEPIQLYAAKTSLQFWQNSQLTLLNILYPIINFSMLSQTFEVLDSFKPS